MYFFRKLDGKNHEFHIIQELMEGGDMTSFLNRFGGQNQQIVLQIAKQII